jgi:ubiquinone/menaquinone biosynthesis C-methylase UbiE
MKVLGAGCGLGRVTVLGEIPDCVSALRELRRVPKPGGVLSVTEMVFDPHYLRRAVVLREASAAGFREKACFSNRVAFTMHLEQQEQH